jgi:hypothetical protein
LAVSTVSLVFAALRHARGSSTDASVLFLISSCQDLFLGGNLEGGGKEKVNCPWSFIMKGVGEREATEQGGGVVIYSRSAIYLR